MKDRFTLDDNEIDTIQYKKSEWGINMEKRTEEYRKFKNVNNLWQKLKEMRLNGFWAEKMEEAADTDQAETCRRFWHKIDKTYEVPMSMCWEPFDKNCYWNEYHNYCGIYHPWNPTKLNRTNGPFSTGGVVHVSAALNQLYGCSYVCLMSTKSCETKTAEEFGS